MILIDISLTLVVAVAVTDVLHTSPPSFDTKSLIQIILNAVDSSFQINVKQKEATSKQMYAMQLFAIPQNFVLWSIAAVVLLIDVWTILQIK